MYKHKFTLQYALALLIGLFSSVMLSAQQGSWGNTFVFGGTEMVVYGQQNFLNGGNGILPGTVGTERTSPQGFLSFVQGASWTGASDNAFVDGYVKTYQGGAFTFPIGDNGVYRPAAVSAASFAGPAWAAYYGVNPGVAVTSSLKGGNEPVLPSGGPFNPALTASGIQNVSTVEYWDIKGATAARITLTWNAASNISAMTGGVLSNLTIVGWDGSKWVQVPSAVDATSLLGTSSTLTSGSVTTTAAIAPNTYFVYTLASSTFSSNLAVTKSVDNMTPKVGSSVTFTITVTNNGPNNATGVKVTDLLPGGYLYIASTVTAGSYTAATGLWTVGSLANGGSATLTVTAFVRATGSYSNTASATSNQPDPSGSDNTSTVTPVPIAITPVSVIKKSGLPVLNQDGTYSWRYTVTLTNNLPVATKDTLTVISLEDDLTRVFIHGETYSVVSVVASGGLTGNGLYDGVSRIELLASGGKLAPQASDSVVLLVKVDPKDYTGKVYNQASLVASSKIAGTITGVLSDDPSNTEETFPRRTITILPGIEIRIPDVITPNGDGYNDNFKIICPGLLKIKLEIFNRWGNKVYTSDDYHDDWNGKGTGNFLGKDLPNGTYYYIIETTDSVTGKVGKYSGYVTLRRN